MSSLKNNMKAAYLTGTLLALNALSPSVLAMTAPTDKTGIGYDIYDIVVNKILHGSIGFVGGVFIIVLAATQLTKSWMFAVGGIVMGSAVLQADKIVVSCGAFLC